MEENELKPCWNVKENDGILHAPIFVGGRHNEELVTCSSGRCMPLNEVYTVEEWQSHPRPATREQLVAALRKARSGLGTLTIKQIELLRAEIDLLLEGELPAADKEGE